MSQACPNEKPTHRTKITINGDTFQPGKLLDKLKRYFVSHDGNYSNVDYLPEYIRHQLHSIQWFDEWLQKLRQKRKVSSTEPSIQDQFKLLMLQHPHAPPEKNSTFCFPMTVDGKPEEFELNSHALLDKLCPNFLQQDLVSPSDSIYIPEELIQRFRQLPWADAWIEDRTKRRKVARLRNVVTKEMKIELLIYYYPRNKPKWKDQVNVVIPDGNSDIFAFYPGTFLDDVVNNWKDENEVSSRPSVLLDKAQMLALESLPWFIGWLNNIKKNRQARPQKSVL